MNQVTPTQELAAKDLHGYEWKFKHIFRGNELDLCFKHIYFILCKLDIKHTFSKILMLLLSQANHGGICSLPAGVHLSLPKDWLLEIPLFF